jgi:hypothetical protein
MAASGRAISEAVDGVRWWRAWQLAERDEVDELRTLAAAGDQHARMQLADWLSERAYAWLGPDLGRLGEAIELIGPLADAGDDVAEMRLASWLADCGRVSELRGRADAGSDHAGRELARALADQDLLDELRDRASRGDQHAFTALISALADRDLHEELRERLEASDHRTRQLIFDAVGGSPAGMNAVRVLADAGHRPSRFALVRRLARQGRVEELRQRAESGDDYARHWLDETGRQQCCARPAGRWSCPLPRAQ